MINKMLTLSTFPTSITFAFELNLGNIFEDLFLRDYCFDIKMLIAPLSRSILQSVSSSKVPTVID